MTPILITLGVLALIAVFVIMWAIGTFNSLVELRNRVKNAFSQIDVQLKRRYDLIPNLIEVAKKFMKHERETLEAVTQARNMAQNANASADPTDPGSMKRSSPARPSTRLSSGSRPICRANGTWLHRYGPR